MTTPATNIADHPNIVRVCGDATYSAHFGALVSITPISIPGDGHHQHVALRFKRGVTLDISLADAIAVARQLPEAIAALAVVPDVSGALVDLGEPA
jgi:hypothetical protein